MKNKSFLLLCAAVIFLTVSGCHNFLDLPGEGGNLMVSIGLNQPNEARATYSPVFNDPPLSTFAKIILTVGTYTYDSTAPGQSVTDTWTVSLPEVPYGAYTITAKAYVNSGDAADKHAAYGTTTHTFNNTNAHAKLTLAPVINEGSGTLKYTLTEPDNYVTPGGFTPITAKLNLYNGTNFNTPDEVLITGSPQTKILTAGFYLLTFGSRVPSIVHIYKDLETVVAETNDIFNLRVNPVTDVDVALSRSGTTLTLPAKIRAGTVILMTMKNQYLPDSVTLNAGAVTSFTGAEVHEGNGVYTRSFTMPNTSVVVNTTKRVVPDNIADFEDYNQQAHLRFWSVTPSAILDTTASRGQEITVRAHNSFNPPTGEMTLSVLSWYLDGNIVQSAGATYTVPSETEANYVGALVVINVNGVPAVHAIAIPISPAP